VAWWLHEHRRLHGPTSAPSKGCARCLGLAFDGAAYAYLLGLYLGDGHIVSKPRQHHLSIYCGHTWPGLIDAAESVMGQIMPEARTGRHLKVGCTEVKSYSRHWTCFFPQHGSGPKHERPISLAPWQQTVVDAHPWEFIRGLIHSDGTRVTNWTVRKVGGQLKRYEYPRYLFTNKSQDILRLYTRALDAVSVEWSVNRRGRIPYHISVARRASVALMDTHVGPKY